MCTPAYADIVVSRAITGIFGAGFKISEPGAIARFLADVPNSTRIGFQMEITVKANGENLADVVVTDRFGGELAVQCVSASEMCRLITKGKTNKVFLTWKIGDLADGDSRSLILVATTDLNPVGKQGYAECGVHDLNSGATAKAKVDRFLPPRSRGSRKRQISNSAESITIKVSGTRSAAFSECSNCLDDDGDGFLDLDDPECSDSSDNAEEIF